jgi:hypothetical protein
MSPEQCRQARIILSWSVIDLADNADLSMETILNFEEGAEEFVESVVASIQMALEYGGVQFESSELSGVKRRL